jgi:hypothetical protein
VKHLLCHLHPSGGRSSGDLPAPRRGGPYPCAQTKGSRLEVAGGGSCQGERSGYSSASSCSTWWKLSR